MAVAVMILIGKLNKAYYRIDRAEAEIARVMNDYSFVVDSDIFAMVQDNDGNIFGFQFIPKSNRGFEFRFIKIEDGNIVVLQKSNYFSDQMYSEWLSKFAPKLAKTFYIRMQIEEDQKKLREKVKQAKSKAEKLYHGN